MKTIIFDLGNVLVGYDQHALLTAVAHLSRKPFAQIQQLAHEYATAFGTGKISAPALHQAHVAATGTPTSYAAFAHAFCQGLWRDEAALAYALALRARPGVQIGILSNTNELHVAWLRQHVPEVWQMDDAVLSNEVGLVKPDPAIYRLALKRLGATAVSTLFIDDLPENVEAAQSLGISGIVQRNWATTYPLIENWLLNSQS